GQIPAPAAEYKASAAAGRAARGPPTLLSARAASRHGDFLRQVHVLDGVEEGDAVLEGPLERLAAGDQARAGGALVDHRRLDRLRQVARPLRLAAGVDQAAPTHVAVDDLVARQVDGVLAGEFRVDLRAGLAELEGLEAAVVRGQLLLDDV